MPADDWPIQIPQDAGSRGVAKRDRDALLESFPRGRFLTLELKADPAFEAAEVSVLDAIGEPVVSALKVPGTSVTFTLQPKTYAARVMTPSVGRVKAPIELYGKLTEEIELRPGEAALGQVSEEIGPEGVAAGGRDAPPGRIAIRSRDPLGTAEIRDEAGQVVGVTTGDDQREFKPGFYRVRHVGPEESGAEQFVVLSAGETETVELQAPTPAPTAVVSGLAKALGGSVEDGHVIPVEGAEPVAWAQPSTIVAAGLGAALGGDELRGLGLHAPHTVLRENGSGIAL